MFDNLVESSSHKQDITRKGSFVIGTLIIYGVLIVAFAIASVPDPVTGDPVTENSPGTVSATLVTVP